MLIGYMRPTEDDRDCTSQTKALKNSGCIKTFSEDHSSPKKRVRLDQALQELEEGDQLAVTKLAVLADSTRHLAEILDFIESKGAYLLSMNEEIDTLNKEGHSFRKIVKSLADFQSDIISQKTKLGLTEAKQKGVMSGRPRKPDENVQKAITMYKSKTYSLAEIKEETGISKSTLYRYLES